MDGPRFQVVAGSGAAWGYPTRGEPRWPATLAVLAACVLYLLLPERLQAPLGPRSLWTLEKWIMPALELALLLPLSIAAPYRRPGEVRWQQLTAVALIAVINLANLASLALLVESLLGGEWKHSGTELLLSSGSIWLTNVIVFGLWYWELDRGGPDERSDPAHRAPDFLFPQMTTPGCAAEEWVPGVVDYLYVAFTNATAFSPTDTMPLTRTAKALMAVQSLISLLTIALVAARAVNILS